MPETVLAQCPEKDFLLKKLTSLQKEKTSSKAGLNELLKYEKNMKNCFDKNDSIHVFLIYGIADAYGRMGEYQQAIQFSRYAIDICKSNYYQNKKFLARTYFNLHIFYDSLNLTSQKNEAIDSCISWEQTIGGDYYYTSIVLKEKVKSLYYKGDYHSCLNYANLGEKLIPGYYHAADSLDYLLFFVNYQTDALYSLGNFDQAEQLLKSRMDIFLRQANNYYAGIVYGLYAFISKSKSDYYKALQYFQKANHFFSLSEHKELSSQVLFQTGRIYLENLDKANNALHLSRCRNTNGIWQPDTLYPCLHNSVKYGQQVNEIAAEGILSREAYIATSRANMAN
jgi:tetratricopeptide (TPR) repeat protein